MRFPADGKGLRSAGRAEDDERREIYRRYYDADINVRLGPAGVRLKFGMVEIEDPCAYCKAHQPCGCEWDALHRYANEEIDHMVEKRFGL